MSSGVILSVYAKYPIDLYLSVGVIVGKILQGQKIIRDIFCEKKTELILPRINVLPFKYLKEAYSSDSLAQSMNTNGTNWADKYPAWNGILRPESKSEDKWTSNPIWTTTLFTLLLLTLALVGFILFCFITKKKRFPPQRRTNSMRLGEPDPGTKVIILDETGPLKKPKRMSDPPTRSARDSQLTSCEYLIPKPIQTTKPMKIAKKKYSGTTRHQNSPRNMSNVHPRIQEK